MTQIVDNSRILLVEDDESLSQWIADYLKQHGYDVHVEFCGDKAIDKVNKLTPALIILDVMLPGKNGFDICRELKPTYPAPILMLTARDDEVDQVVGLELGADDYVIKPVQPRVLLARVQMLLRRYQLGATPTPSSNQIIFDKLLINQSSRSLSYKHSIIPLSDAEFDLLWLLANSPYKPLSRDEILRNLRGIDYDGLDRSIDGRISQLRRKLQKHTGHTDKIKTVRGKGYMFISDSWL